MNINSIYQGDALEMLKTFPDEVVDCCVTSPPDYGLRDYGISSQIGLEETPELYIEHLTAIFMEVYRVLKPSGTLWLNIGDSDNGSGKNSGNTCKMEWKQRTNAASHAVKPTKVKELKSKDLIGIPWMLAFELRRFGWYLRQDIIWYKSNPMPESVKDRCTRAHEYIFLLTKSKKYYFNLIQEPAAHDRRKDCNMHNRHDVWNVFVKPYYKGHFATFPPKLIVPCIKAGCPENGIVLDPFMGAGTTAMVARKLNRNFIGIELNPDYIKIAEQQLHRELGIFE
jgi:DNA modification methylase